MLMKIETAYPSFSQTKIEDMSNELIPQNFRQLRDSFDKGYVAEIHIHEVAAGSPTSPGYHYEIRYTLLAQTATYFIAPFGKSEPRTFQLHAALLNIRPFVLHNTTAIYLDPSHPNHLPKET
jgi:hypothetical protein